VLRLQRLLVGIPRLFSIEAVGNGTLDGSMYGFLDVDESSPVLL